MQTDPNRVSIEGARQRERFDCIRQEWQINEWTLSHNRVTGANGQSILEYFHRRERMRDADRISGYFLGLYASRTHNPAETRGRIDGLGVAAGLYGARRLEKNLILDYNLGAAYGHHRFNLEFPHIDQIHAEGTTDYLALYGGLGLSGEWQRGDTIFTPRLSLSLAHADGIRVDATATQGAARETQEWRLDGFTTGRLTAEIGISNDLDLKGDGKGLWDGLDMGVILTPALFCESVDFGALSCGWGLALALDENSDDGHRTTSAEISYEQSTDVRRAAVAFKQKRRLERFKDAEVTRTLSYSDTGEIALGLTFDAKF